MNRKTLLTASLTGGLISLLLVNTPVVNLINLLLCAGFWLGPLVAGWLYRRTTGTLTLRDAVITGVLAAGWHALFGLLLSPLGLAGAGSLLNDVRPFVSAQDLPGIEASLMGLGGLVFNLAGALIDLAFGFLGGLIGGAVFGVRRLPASGRTSNAPFQER